MSLSARRRIVRSAVVLVTVVSLGAPLAATASGPVIGTPVAEPRRVSSPANPDDARAGEVGVYTNPIYFPLRKQAWISCAKDNCIVNGKVQHGHWAQDWTGEFQLDPKTGTWDELHPVYAAGSGQAIIIRNNKSCGSAFVGETRMGTAVAIDHGGGVYSVYEHIEIEVEDGQWVTPTTRIGTMNAHGSNSCKNAYLHFEIRSGGLSGDYEPFNEMRACIGAETAILPDDLTPYDPTPNDNVPPEPYETWNDIIPYYTVDGDRSLLRTPVTNARCIPTTFTTPPKPARLRTRVTRDSITVTSPVAPTGTRRTILSIEKYRPDRGEYEDAEYVELEPADTSHTFSGLIPGRTYRLKVAHRNGVGTSPWSSTITAAPAEAPDAPRIGRLLSATKTAISFGWYRAVDNGATPTGYQAQIRQKVRGVWGDWETVRLGPTTTYYRWLNLRSGRDHQIRVRALSAVGPSPWSKVAAITTAS